jgi:asparagine synthase (glutamine-hydrolysing)
MKINGMREKHVLREATRDVLIEPVYGRQKHPFSTPPTKVGARDALRELFGEVLNSSLLDEQPIFAPAAVRGLFEAFPGLPAGDRMRVDGLMNRIVSLTLMHQRFGMSA